jgi:type IV secretory pathway component VirB8
MNNRMRIYQYIKNRERWEKKNEEKLTNKEFFKMFFCLIIFMVFLHILFTKNT